VIPSLRPLAALTRSRDSYSINSRQAQKPLDWCATQRKFFPVRAGDASLIGRGSPTAFATGTVIAHFIVGQKQEYSSTMRQVSPIDLPTFDSETDELQAVIETPRGSRIKFDFDPKTTQFKLGGILPEGMVFPYEFGFLPSTKGGDGDPLDILVLIDAPTSMGCVLTARLLGVIEAEQTEQDQRKACRNDRLIAVATHAHIHGDAKKLSDINSDLLDEIEDFFVFYNRERGKLFRPLGRYGPKRAMKLVNKGMKAYKRHRKNGHQGT
jgi:inorganic pyrophosphatase